MMASSSSSQYSEKQQQRRNGISTKKYLDLEDGDDTTLTGRNKLTTARKARYQRLHHPTKPQLLFDVVHKIKLPLAVLIWYLLGVLSISTTKILLRDWTKFCTPTTITIQQFAVGVTFLRFWIYMTNSQHQIKTSTFIPIMRGAYQWIVNFGRQRKRNSSLVNHSNTTRDTSTTTTANINLFASSAFFTLGFYFTNLSFFGSDASYVETIKASEPMTSATVSVLWGLEQLSHMEIVSLLGICGGVVISTLGSASTAKPAIVTNITISTSTALGQSLVSSGIVLMSNLCFSFRGLYQKLFRSSPQGSPMQLNDIGLQFQMQLTGILLMMGPFIMRDVPRLISLSFEKDMEASDNDDFSTYFMLAIVNGFAFTHYNLASTYVLSQLSVVHHAALNCIRRLFAIIVTSFVFQVPITIISGLGVSVSLAGFLSYTHYKAEKLNKPRPLSSLLPLSE